MILCVNHLNWTDIHILGASLPLSHRPWWVAKIEMFENRLANWWLREMQVIPIKRGRRSVRVQPEHRRKIGGGIPLLALPDLRRRLPARRIQRSD